MARLARELAGRFPALSNARWVALRLLEGDPRITEAVRSGELGRIGRLATAAPGAGEIPP